MPGDEVHEEPGGGAAAAPDAGRRRAGARHAAPRKALLNRLHMPAGKAIALAAMPSAVLLGMGITPQIASAKSIPKNPFKGDTCVSEQDQAQEDDEGATGAAGDAADKAGKAAEDAGDAIGAEADKASSAAEEAATAAKVRATKAVKDAEKAAKEYQAAKKKSEDDSADSGGLLGGGSDGSDSSGDDAADEEEPENPLDPLGLGDKLKDLFTPDDSDDATDESAESSEDSADSESAEEEKAPPETDPTLRKLQKEAEEAKEKAEASLADAKAKLAKAKKQAAKESEKSGSSQESEKGSTDKDSDASEKQGSDSDSADSKDSGKASEKAEGNGDIPDLSDLKKDENGQASYPCVEEKKDDGENETTPAAIPDDPWELKASSLTLHSLDYQGVVNLTTASGKKKQALKFTASGLEIGDLHQTVQGPGGKTYHVRGAEGSTSTVDDGEVTMYTEELKGNLFGLIPITFSPESPPPLNVPEAYFTDVNVKQAAQFGGTLTVPGLQMDITD